MATFNFTSSTNNINPVLWSLGTKLEYHTDRESGLIGRGGFLLSVENLGVGVGPTNDPFTLMA